MWGVVLSGFSCRPPAVGVTGPETLVRCMAHFLYTPNTYMILVILEEFGSYQRPISRTLSSTRMPTQSHVLGEGSLAGGVAYLLHVCHVFLGV